MQIITLANQVCFVRGMKRAVLLDLLNGRLHRIPISFVDAFVDGVLVDSNAISSEWLHHLIINRFLKENKVAACWNAFQIDWQIPPCPILHTIAVSRYSNPEFVFNWISESSEFHPRHMIFENPLPIWTSTKLAEIATSVGLRSFEITDGSIDCANSSDVYAANGRHLFKRKSSDEAIGCITTKLSVDFEFYLLSQTYAETFGYLYIKDTVVLPHKNERHIEFGDIENVCLDSIMKDEKYLIMSQANKDKRQKCKGCELRYVCTHSISRRESADIFSGPYGCHYDPNAANDQSELFVKR